MTSDENINFFRAKTTRDEIKIFFEDLANYKLPQEKQIHAGIRGLTEVTLKI